MSEEKPITLEDLRRSVQEAEGDEHLIAQIEAVIEHDRRLHLQAAVIRAKRDAGEPMSPREYDVLIASAVRTYTPLQRKGESQ